MEAKTWIFHTESRWPPFLKIFTFGGYLIFKMATKS